MNQIQKRPKAGESGQAIILLALALTALLGFIALAVDGGILFVDRRAAQNAADAASLAGAGALARVIDARDANHNNMDCSSSHIQAALAAGRQAAIERAAENGYIIDGDASDNNGVEATCGFNTLHGMTYKYVDLRVVITVETTSSLPSSYTMDRCRIQSRRYRG